MTVMVENGRSPLRVLVQTSRLPVRSTEPPRHSNALPRYQMAADQSVFVPDQSNHHDIEDRQHDEAEATRVREAVELVDDEEAKDDKRSRIRSEERRVGKE